ncbi:MAG: T9SS type A sorting domain-containing protein, partial [Candidatus Zixiibacteriota bacterium]
IYIDRSVNPITTSIWGDDYENQDNIQSIDIITLYQNYPNPFNPQTNIEFVLKESGQVKIEIFNILGQKVITLIDQYLEKGHKSISWVGRDNQAQKLSSGVYWYKIQAGNFTQTKKMLLLK